LFNTSSIELHLSASDSLLLIPPDGKALTLESSDGMLYTISISSNDNFWLKNITVKTWVFLFVVIVILLLNILIVGSFTYDSLSRRRAETRIELNKRRQQTVPSISSSRRRAGSTTDIRNRALSTPVPGEVPGIYTNNEPKNLNILAQEEFSLRSPVEKISSDTHPRRPYVNHESSSSMKITRASHSKTPTPLAFTRFDPSLQPIVSRTPLSQVPSADSSRQGTNRSNFSQSSPGGSPHQVFLANQNHKMVPLDPNRAESYSNTSHARPRLVKLATDDVYADLHNSRTESVFTTRNLEKHL